MWGYPATPVLFLVVTVYFVGNTLVTRPGPSLAGLGLIATGVPVYFFWRRSASRHASGGPLRSD
jgi:APA family basic amino acid/polyamine antiporter